MLNKILLSPYLLLCLLIIYSCSDVPIEDMQIEEPNSDEIEFNVTYSVTSAEASTFPLQSLKENLDSSAYDLDYGLISYPEATVVSYPDSNSHSIAIIPIIDVQRNTYITSIVSFYHQESDLYNTFIMDISAELDPSSSSTYFSGVIKYKTLENYVLIEGHFDDGITKEILTYDPDGVSNRSGNYECIIECLNTTMNSSGPFQSQLVKNCATGLKCCNGSRSWLNSCCQEIGSCLVATIGVVGSCLENCN